MKIELHKILVRDLVKGYKDSQEDGVVAYGGNLDVRPAYQREFVYGADKRNEVIHTIRKNFPLNVMYWVANEDGKYEVLDGQQCTISICQYVNGDFSIEEKYFHNLTEDKKEEILSYELMVYFCEGTDSEKLEWFKIINIAGIKLTDQELRNAVYVGSWLSDAKRYFSRNGCAAYKIANRYLSGNAIRQEYLETAIDWISEGCIENYMAKHQHDSNAQELWNYFQNVINWIIALFPEYRKEMKSVKWGCLYNKLKDKNFDVPILEKQIKELMQDDDITKLSGIYEYILTGNEKALNIRAFDDKTKRRVYEKQQGICKICGTHFKIEQMHADHIIPWSKGGHTTIDNCQMLCTECNIARSNNV